MQILISIIYGYLFSHLIIGLSLLFLVLYFEPIIMNGELKTKTDLFWFCVVIVVLWPGLVFSVFYDYYKGKR